MIEQYHAIDKAVPDKLQMRIALLNSIASYLGLLEDQSKFDRQKGAIGLFKQAVLSKKNYLDRLLEIPCDEAIDSYHFDTSKLLDPRYKPLFLRNDITYSLKMREFWGKFWLESIDPGHRRLANFYQFWLNTKPLCQSYQSFFLWLESQPIPKNVPSVLYYSDAQIERCRVELRNGYLANPHTQALITTDPSVRNLFVIHLSKELYFAPWKEGIWHTTLSQGKPLLGAGLLHIENGVIRSVPFESGHYLPSLEESFQSLQILKDRGARFSEPFEVVYFENRNKYKVSLSMKDLETFEIFSQAIRIPSKRELMSANEF